MLKLSIMTEEELAHLFGDLDAYIPLHEGKLQQRGAALQADSTLAPRAPSDAELFIYFYLNQFTELLKKLDEETGPDGTVAQIGQIVIDWVWMDIDNL